MLSTPEHETPSEIGRFLALWAIRRRTDKVLDPAMGSGALLRCAFDRLRQLGVRSPGPQLFGVEIDTDRRDAATRRFEAAGRFRPTLILNDFLGLAKRDNPFPGNFEAIICNPPFLRRQEIPASYRIVLDRIAFPKKADGNGGSGLAGLHLHFILKALEFARPGGRLAFVLPSTMFSAAYSARLKSLLRNQTTISGLLIFDPELLVFPGVLTSTALLLITKRRPIPEHKAVVAELHQVGQAEELLRVLGSREGDGFGDVFRSRQSRWSPRRNWGGLSAFRLRPTKGARQLDDFVAVRRGIATGANSYFTLSGEAARALDLPAGSLKRIASTAGLHFYDFCEGDLSRLESCGEKTYLFSVTPTYGEQAAVRKYIELGEATGIPHRYLTSHRRNWFVVERVPHAPVLFTYMTRKRPRFVLNKTGAVHLNNLLGVYPRSGVSTQSLPALLALLNCTEFVKRLPAVGRPYAGGLLKVEPGDLVRSTIPDITQLDVSTRTELGDAFQRLCYLARIGRAVDGLSELDGTVSDVTERF